MDDFGHSLDAITRGSCAVCAARAARSNQVALVIATSLPDVAEWLQPDGIIQLSAPKSRCDMPRRPTLIRNFSAAARPIVSFHILPLHSGNTKLTGLRQGRELRPRSGRVPLRLRPRGQRQARGAGEALARALPRHLRIQVRAADRQGCLRRRRVRDEGALGAFPQPRLR